MRVTPRKSHVSSSDESIENLLYYKDCQHKPKGSTEPPILRNDIQPTPPARQPDCPFPKMCCSMSCGNDCGGPQSYLSRQMEPLQSLGPIQPLQSPPRPPRLPVMPQIMQRARKKKNKPVPSRRDAGFTKEKIKRLISQDGDIRKILKDLVRVTMQKVDLIEMVSTRRNENQNQGTVSETSANSEDY